MSTIKFCTEYQSEPFGRTILPLKAQAIKTFAPNILPGMLVVLYCYIYAMTLSFAQVRAALLFGPADSLVLFRTDLIPFAAGLLAFIFLISRREIRFFCIAASLAVPLALIVIFFVSSRIILFVGVYLALFSCGIIGGFTYCTMAASIGMRPHMGKVFGISNSAVVLFQFTVQTVLNSTPVMLYSLIVASFAAAFLIPVLSEQMEKAISRPVFADIQKLRKSLLAAVIIAMCFEYLAEFLAYELVKAVPENTVFLYGFPRLFMIPGYMIMGICADIRNMKYVPLLTLCCSLFAILNPVLFSSETYGMLNSCIFYAVAGVINSYLVFGFWKILYDFESVKSDVGRTALTPAFFALICVSGRLADSLCNVVFTDSMVMGMSLPVTVFIQLAVIIFIIIMMALTGQFSFLHSAEETNIFKRELPDMQRFSSVFGLTERETEIFVKLLEHKGTMAELANELFISRSVLYRHIRSICEKTGTDHLGQTIRLYDSGEYDNKTHAAVIMTPLEKEELIRDGVCDPKSVNNNSREMVADLEEFAKKYDLTENEITAFRLFLESPGRTQKELAEIHGCTLRTMQRYLAGLRKKTGAETLAECLIAYQGFSGKRQ